MEFIDYIEIDGVSYTDLVPRGYRYNILTEDLIFGDELSNGMKVLCPTQLDDHTVPDLYHASLPVNNRWCKVTSLRLVGDSIKFLGVYEDGRKAIRAAYGTEGWVVTKSSIPSEPSQDSADGETQVERNFRAFVGPSKPNRC